MILGCIRFSTFTQNITSKLNQILYSHETKIKQIITKIPETKKYIGYDSG